MNSDPDNKRFLRSAALLPVATCLLAAFAAVANDNPETVAVTEDGVVAPDLNPETVVVTEDGVVAPSLNPETVVVTGDGVVAPNPNPVTVVGTGGQVEVSNPNPETVVGTGGQVEVSDPNPETVVGTGGQVGVSDLNARSDFRIANIVAYQYLVVTLTITEDHVTAAQPTLARGPKKANGVIDDLRVKAFEGQLVKAEYSMADPRFVRWQAADRFTLGHKSEIRDSGKRKIYIPLSAAIDKVVIETSPDSRPGVSKGGQFDPRPLARAACREHDRTRFPACVGFGPPASALGGP